MAHEMDYQDIGTYPSFNGVCPPESRKKDFFDWYNHPDFVEWENEILDQAPDAWDDDVSSTEIVTRFVNHLVEEVKRTGGCLYPWCLHKDFEPCDHGYLEAPAEPPVNQEVIDDLMMMAAETATEEVCATCGEPIANELDHKGQALWGHKNPRENYRYYCSLPGGNIMKVVPRYTGRRLVGSEGESN